MDTGLNPTFQRTVSGLSGADIAVSVAISEPSPYPLHEVTPWFDHAFGGTLDRAEGSAMG
jgi:hypothetical protein